MSNTVSKNIFWLTLSRALALVLLFFAYAKLLRYLGHEVYGQYNFVLSYVLLFSTVVDFGLNQFITKKMSESPGETKKYFQTFLAFEIVVAFLLYALLMAIAVFNHYGREVTTAIAVAGLGMVANALTYPFLTVMTAAQNLRKVALINFINSFVNITFIFFAIYLRKSIVFLAFIQLTFGIVDLILYWHFVKDHLPKPDVLKTLRNYDFGIIKNILAKAWPFVLLVGFSSIYNRIDMVLITKMLGYGQGGYYGAAYKIFDLLNFFPAIVSLSLFPHFAKLMAQGAVAEVRSNLEKYVRLMLAVAIPMAVGGMILAQKLIVASWYGGPEYAPSGPILAILIWAPALQFIYIPANSLVISQLTKKAMVITGVNVIVNTVGNLILLPHYGIKAAAIMTVISESLQGIFYFYFIWKSITHFAFFSLLIKPLIAAAVMGALLLKFYNLPLITDILAGSVVYVVVLIITGFLKKQDITTFKQMFKAA